MKPSVSIKGLGKKYRLTEHAPYLSLRDTVNNAFRRILKPSKTSNEFWALQDLNLDVMPGERIGIIGRNGAGKSTLLKIISRITPPTKGHVRVYGRVGSLLEVGTGFHPELSGLENIYLNGSILGLKRREIKNKLEEIIDFSGTGKFLHTPLKHYSSGMQLRLAFSVAAHLDPEILLIDEVLAVGDAEFQKKCLGKMEEVSRSSGRTILFVSHNLDTIRKFCPKVILLDQGAIKSQGSADYVITQYLSSNLQTTKHSEWQEGVLSYNKDVLLRKAYMHDRTGINSSRFGSGEEIGVTMIYDVLADGVQFTHGINLYNKEQVNIFNSHDVTSGSLKNKKSKGTYSATVWIPGNLLPEGLFSLNLALFLPNPLDVMIHQQDALRFEVFADYSKLNARGDYTEEFPGVIRPLLNWEYKRNQ